MGKLGQRELATIIKCVRRTSSVLVPPGVGFDSGVHRIPSGSCLAISTDPCMGVPKVWFGWLLVHYSASDVAVFGVEPKFCAVNLLGPPGTPLHLFQEIMKDACEAANELGMQIVTGHTGRYTALRDVVGTCTAYGFARKIMTPKDVKPGDSILLTKPLGLETAVNFARKRRRLARKLFGEARTARLSRQFKFQSCVKEALALAKMPGVHAMHDAAEGGLVSSLNEMAEASDTGFSLNLAKVAVPKEVRTLAAHFELTTDEVISMSSTGTLAAALAPGVESRVMRRLSELRIPAHVVGTFLGGGRRRLTTDIGERRFPAMARDPFSKICG
jgi:hydrogenase maturation factor